MSDFNGAYVNMPIKVVCKSCGKCRRFEVENDQDVQILSSGEVLVENDLRCAHLDECVRIYQEMKKWETDRKPVEIELEGGGSNWWYVCEECRGSVSDQDDYCKHCGVPFKKPREIKV